MCICMYVCCIFVWSYVFRIYQRIWKFLVMSAMCHMFPQTTSSCLIAVLKDRLLDSISVKFHGISTNTFQIELENFLVPKVGDIFEKS